MGSQVRAASLGAAGWALGMRIAFLTEQTSRTANGKTLGHGVGFLRQ